MRAYLFGLLLFISGGAFAEEYVLAVNWQAEFCHSRANNQSCQSIRPEQFGATNFTLHGLWPAEQTYCQLEDGKKNKKRRWKDLPAVVLTPETKQSLSQVMPGIVEGFDRYQWTKHGTCAGASQEKYFKKSVDLTKQVAKSDLSFLLRSKIGQQVSLAALQSVARTEFGKDAGSGLKFLCAPGDKSGESTQVLFEMRFYLEANSVEDVNLKSFAPSPPVLGITCKDGPIYIRPFKMPTSATTTVAPEDNMD